MIVLDTTVLVYAKGSAHALREPCRELIAAVGDGRLEATTTAEAIQEFAHVYARRRTRTVAASLARDYAALLSPLLRVEESALERGMSLFESSDRIGAFDAVLAAAALEAGSTDLVSADRAFAAVPRLNHVFPDSERVKALMVSEAS